VTKILSCQWAAASLDRFAAEDIANLVSDASRSTIDDVISNLRQQDLIERVAIRPLGRGRPRVEYAWRKGAREHRRESLEAEMSGLDRVRAEAADRYAEFALVEDANRLRASLDQIKALVDAALMIEDPRQKKTLAARAEAEYAVLKTMQAEDPSLADFRLFEAGRQLERLLTSAEEHRIWPTMAGGRMRGFWEPLVAGARAPAEAVLDHFAAPLLNPRRISGWVPAEFAKMSAPGDDFTLILDTSAGAPDPWLDAYASARGHGCAVLHLSDASEGELDTQLRSLLKFFVTPVSANTHVCMFVDGSEHSNASVKEIAHVFGDPGSVRAAFDAARDTLAHAAAAVDGEVLGAFATSSVSDEPDWISRGLKRHFAIGMMTVKEDLAQETLLKATLNDPVVVSDRPITIQKAVAAFGEVRVASLQEMVATAGRVIATTID
jgi:hypothetical protein